MAVLGSAATLRRLRRLTQQVAARDAAIQRQLLRRAQLVRLAYGLARRRLLAAGAVSRMVTVGSQPLHSYVFEDTGSGDTAPLVFLHGLADRAETWSLMLPGLRRLGNIYAPDLPGFGASPPPPGCRSATIEQHVTAMTAYLREYVGRPVLLVGSSMGGWIAARIAAREPGLVLGLVLLDPGGAALNGVRSWLPFLRYLLLDSTEARRRTLAALYHTVPLPLYAAPDVLIELFHQPNVLDLLVHLTRDDLLSARELQQIAAATLLIWGASDRFLPAESLTFFQSNIRRVQCQIIARCGHLPQHEHPFQTMRLIRSFLDDIQQKWGRHVLERIAPGSG